MPLQAQCTLRKEMLAEMHTHRLYTYSDWSRELENRRTGAEETEWSGRQRQRESEEFHSQTRSEQKHQECTKRSPTLEAVERLQGPEVRTHRAAVPSPLEVALLATLLGRVGPRRTVPGASRETHQIKSNTDRRRSTSVGAGVGRATA
ncbi:hypothetical protein BJV77DRAFT_966443 [Russula vinacea]|nr:hypothetical protein BJV77DRAFT_966443 [Russula vinacea]